MKKDQSPEKIDILLVRIRLTFTETQVIKAWKTAESAVLINALQILSLPIAQTIIPILAGNMPFFSENRVQLNPANHPRHRQFQRIAEKGLSGPWVM